MSKTLRRATGSSLAILFVALVGCGPDDAKTSVDPMATDLMPTHATETVVIDGASYVYGCPDYPCPVTDLVKNQIEGGNWFWMPSNGYSAPMIYLYSLQTPVKLRPVTGDPPPPPPFVKIDPYLTGPSTMEGTRLADQQLACLNVGLAIMSPDGRSWQFQNGQRRLVFGNGSTAETYVFGTDWGYLAAGMYGVYPGPETTGYDVEFSIKVVGADGESMMLGHSMRCEDPTPPEPMAPALVGPVAAVGEMMPETGLICRSFDLDLESPDGGPWSFMSGTMTLTYMRWGYDVGKWIDLGWPKTVVRMGGDMWSGLLNGRYTIVPKMASLAYQASFEATVRRVAGTTIFDNPVDHKMMCATPDLYARVYGPR